MGEPSNAPFAETAPDGERPALMVCDNCGTGTAMPQPCAFAPLWDAGWRWRGKAEDVFRFVPRTFAYSCPNCPPLAA